MILTRYNFTSLKNKGRSYKRETTAGSAVALHDHLIHRHQLQDLSLADSFKSRTRNTKNIYKPLNKEEDAEKEYVLDPSLPQLTLAQKLSLVELPALPVAAEEWVKIKQRSIQCGDTIRPCAICREEFALQPQVLLSCSHVFYKACLKAFEKFTGKTSLIHDGARLFKIKFKVKKNLLGGDILLENGINPRKSVPPKDSKLRKLFFEEGIFLHGRLGKQSYASFPIRPSVFQGLKVPCLAINRVSVKLKKASEYAESCR
uniref:Ring finger protein 32 n=1 Tax=Otus sunia TaxID=257818 RepID=A0A8C8BIA7_9STRI